MTARLEHKMDKDKNTTELFINSKDDKVCVCILRAKSEDFHVFNQINYDDVNELLKKLVDSINKGFIQVDS